MDAGNGVAKLQLSQRFREPRRQRIGASPGDKERNCNQQLHERVFCAALPHVETVWEVHQKDRSEHDDDDARRAKSDQNAAQNRQPSGKLCQPHQVPDHDRQVQEGGKFLRAGTSESTEENSAAVGKRERWRFGGLIARR